LDDEYQETIWPQRASPAGVVGLLGTPGNDARYVVSVHSVTLDWPYRGDRSMGPHHLALEIAQSATAERKSLAIIINQHKFFIDWFSVS